MTNIVGDALNRVSVRFMGLWCVCDELDGASQQFHVSSLYDNDAEQQQSATTSSKRFAEPLSAEDLHVV